jgi:shikimate kinase
VHLDVPVEVLAERLAPVREGRPLLAPGPDAAPLHEVVERLLAVRRARYFAVADLVVDGSGTPAEVAEHIIAWAMEAGDVLTPSEHEQVMT